MTTSAGVKLQPYFDVPGVNDGNLYHWTIIGESIDPGDVRIWLTARTAGALRSLIGSLDKDVVSSFVLEFVASKPEEDAQAVGPEDADAVVEVMMTKEAYAVLGDTFPSTNDDHLIQQLLQ